MSGNWHIALAESNREALAVAALRGRQYEVYCPWLPKKTHRTHRVVRTIMRPMFPGYIFVNEAPFGWEPLRITPGIRVTKSLMMVSGHYAVLGDAVIQAIAAKEGEEFARIANPKPKTLPYKAGDVVKIVDGPFKGFFAKIETLDDEARIALLMSLLGRESRVFATHEHLAPIGS